MEAAAIVYFWYVLCVYMNIFVFKPLTGAVIAASKLSTQQKLNGSISDNNDLNNISIIDDENDH